MSSLRIGLVCEGPTDFVVIEAALRSILGTDRPFVLNALQPEGSAVFGNLGTGWGGVYRWCQQAAGNGGGRLGNFRLLFSTHDLLILHIDADVAGKKYQDGNLIPKPTDAPLPCEMACPPAHATTSELRRVLLSWGNEQAVPYKTILCIPSKSIEAWVIAALFPDDRMLKSEPECYPDPESRLRQQKKTARFDKSRASYLDRQEKIERQWPVVAAEGRGLNEARRFEMDVLTALVKVDVPAAKTS